MKRSLIALLALFLACACQKYAPVGQSAVGDEAKGGHSGSNDSWISSGGELVRDGRNPWWLENTAEVKYCIHVDEKTVSVDADVIERSFKEATDFWKTQFEKQRALIKKEASYLERQNLRIATQTFVSGCDADTRLHLYVGVGTLDDKQKTFMGNLNQIVSHAVRTDYDPIQMRGSGFIYVSSDLGDERFNREDKSAEGIYLKDGAILTTVLMHEAGHLFGLQDEGSGNTLMSLRYIENLIGINAEFERQIQRKLDSGIISSFEVGKFARYLPDFQRMELFVKRKAELGRKKRANLDVDFTNPFYRKALTSYIRQRVQEWFGHYPPTSFVVPEDRYVVENMSTDMESFLEQTTFGGESLIIEKRVENSYISLQPEEGGPLSIYELKSVLSDEELVVVYFPPGQKAIPVMFDNSSRIGRSPQLTRVGNGLARPDGGAEKVIYFKMGPGPHNLELSTVRDDRILKLVTPPIVLDPNEVQIDTSPSVE